MIIKKSVEKSPFQWGIFNNYLQEGYGKKHFWGFKGRDYGLVESRNNQKEQQNKMVRLQKLKSQHIAFQPYKSRFNPDRRDGMLTQKKEEREHRPEMQEHEQYEPYRNKRFSTVDANRDSENNLNPITEPIHTFMQRRAAVKKQKESKKAHLSLFSRNISLNNNSQSQIRQQTPYNRLNPDHEADGQMNRKRMSDATRRERIRTQMTDYRTKEMDEIRQRIVRVVHKDRKLNPTFCNSINYPLNCYRHIE